MTHSAHNRVRQFRQAQGWSQGELAARAGISRTAVSAIEGGRLVPSVAAALALARVLGCTVEELFEPAAADTPSARWAWEPSSPHSAQQACRYWLAEVAGQQWLYPAETTCQGLVAHDGLAPAAPGGSGPPGWQPTPTAQHTASATLVLAGCDPAASLLAAEYQRQTPFRMIALARSSHQALELLKAGRVHVAGVHLGPAESTGNERAVLQALGPGFHLLRLADWEQGVALSPHTKPPRLHALVRARLRWVAREPGSGARQCLDELFGRPRPWRRIAADHRTVAAAIRSGWADAGVCIRLVSEEAGLGFVPIRWESYDLCYPAALEGDPRLTALVKLVRSPAWRELLGAMPGYQVRQTGSLTSVT